jgi:hypothetical protein
MDFRNILTIKQLILHKKQTWWNTKVLQIKQKQNKKNKNKKKNNMKSNFRIYQLFK